MVNPAEAAMASLQPEVSSPTSADRPPQLPGALGRLAVLAEFEADLIKLQITSGH
jgi:hypothetical protein